jgi:outer membrane protein assembly factor BamB
VPSAAHRLRSSARTLVTLLIGATVVAGCGSSAKRSHTTPSPGPSSPSAAGPVGSAGPGWPALLHGPSHFGAATVTGPQTDRLRWQRNLGGPIVAGPVTTTGGQAYVASDAGTLFDISVATGATRWHFSGGAAYGVDLSTAPMVLPNGVVIWPGPHNCLYALSASGRLEWTLAGKAQPLTPVLDPATGALVVANIDGQISGYRLNGSHRPVRLWSDRLASVSFGNPAVAADGTIYETAGNSLFAIDPQGQIRWHVKTPDAVEVSAAVAVNGIVVFGSDNRVEYGVNPGGRIRWRVPIGNYTYSSPLALAGRRVIFGNHSGQMTTLDSDTGQVISRDAGSGELWTAAAVDARGDAYFASRSGQIFGFTSSGHQLFDLNTGGKFDSYPALAPDGTLLVGSDSGTLYAIG